MQNPFRRQNFDQYALQADLIEMNIHNSEYVQSQGSPQNFDNTMYYNLNNMISPLNMDQ